jgi:RNA polymerase sigma-70 factor (ECF subfamily)
LVLAAARGDASSAANAALAELCRAYWYPLYAYIRRRGHDANAGEDLTQEFFARLLAADFLKGVAPDKGKFRSFLLAALKHFLANQRDHAQAQKRGGGRAILSLDAVGADSRFRLEPAHDLTPERLFERQWALTLLGQVLDRLHAEFAAAGKQAIFAGLQKLLTADRERLHVAVELGMTEGAVKMAAHRMRRRYRALLRDEVAHTVASPAEIDDEIHYLLSCL